MSQSHAFAGDQPGSRPTGRLSIAVADVGWFTTEHLFRAVDPARADTLLLQGIDFVNARNKRIPPWQWFDRTRQTSTATWERRHILPPGWMSRFPDLGMKPIASSIRRWYTAHGAGPLVLVITYPQYLTLSRQVKPDLQIYFNVDDYRLYWPDKAQRIEDLEHEAVRTSDLTVCVAQYRADELRKAVPSAVDRIIHLPHGAPSSSLSPDAVDRPCPAPADLAELPRPLIGYVGSLEDRVDWGLLDRVATTFTEASIVLIGKLDGSGSEDWRKLRDLCLSRPNVHAIGWRPQSEIAAYNRAFDVALIPYAPRHPFNIACCPTKIMDTFASARPVVSTALPECRLHRGLIEVAEDYPAFLHAIGSLLANNSNDGLGRARLSWASEHTCEHVAAHLLDRVDRILADRTSSR